MRGWGLSSVETAYRVSCRVRAGKESPTSAGIAEDSPQITWVPGSTWASIRRVWSRRGHEVAVIHPGACVVVRIDGVISSGVGRAPRQVG